MIEAEIARSTRNTIGRSLRRSAERFRTKTALAFAGRSWTYAELDLAADRVARRLLALGLEPGGRVCAFGRSSDGYLLLWLGYWDMPEATAHAFEGGWFHSGDIATTDAEGYLTIVDRAKDLINTGGTLVASREVEEVLFTHPAVAETAVIATPDPKWIEAVTAVVVLQKGAGGEPHGQVEQELIAYARERLAPFKVPKQVFIVDSLPKNTAGKILKRELRDRYAGTSVAASWPD